ncbi:MAG: DNA-3-methyladenine glycosylase 2 family protein [bacterium]|nr:DNA-3-methyladenine glycosylase 2 family protein [bacterium]
MDSPAFIERRIEIPRGYSLHTTLSGLRMGRFDPTLNLAPNAASMALPTPEGPCALEAASRGAALQVRLAGAGASWIDPRVEALLGLLDAPQEFRPTDARLARLHRRLGDIYLPRLPLIFPRVVQVVLLQIVAWRDAVSAWKRLVEMTGRRLPEFDGLILPPTAEALLATAPHDLVGCGMLPRQARVLRRAAKLAAGIERNAALGADELAAALHAIPGIGDWTVQYVLGSALGFADAVLTGDYNLPGAVARALTGEAQADDARMLALLEPFRPHRFRVIRLLWTSGVKAPRRGPRARLRRFR